MEASMGGKAKYTVAKSVEHLIHIIVVELSPGLLYMKKSLITKTLRTETSR
ncbi:MAG TPA: hypothetical protein VIH03_03990 [Nitrososphaerales archaeon]